MLLEQIDMHYKNSAGSIVKLGLILGLLLSSPLAWSEIKQYSEEGVNVESDIEVGQRRLIEVNGQSSELLLGGARVVVSPGFAILGSSSDHRYLAVISGGARVDKLKVKTGEVLLLHPFGDPPTKAIFEAKSLAGFSKGFSSELDKKLSKLIRSQNRKLFFGRYTKTAFDLQSPGGVEQESQRKTFTGQNVVNKIRFSGSTDQSEIERQVVHAFIDSMNTKQLQAASALISPDRFGGDELGLKARFASAKLMSERWLTVDDSTINSIGDRRWGNDQVELSLIILGDFIYVASVTQK